MHHSLCLFMGLICVIWHTTHGLKDEILFQKGYDSQMIPMSTTDGSPLQINVSINLRNIMEVNEKSQYVVLETSLRLVWIDPRVDVVLTPDVGEFISLNDQELIQTFWIPDIFVDQVKSMRAPTLERRPATLRIHPGGRMRYSSRVNYDVACNMDFHHYPVDKQVCEIKFESFGYTSDQIQFQWDPVSSNVNPNISLDQFQSEIVFESSYATDYYAKSYPGVILRIHLARKMNYHLIQTYIPSFLFVIIAWLSLFISPEAIPGRVSMVMMTMLTLMSMFSGVRQSTPKVSYVSFLDIWMIMCVFFIFLVLIEFSIVSAMIRKGQRAQADRIERLGLILIPTLILIFNLAYWFWLLAAYNNSHPPTTPDNHSFIPCIRIPMLLTWYACRGALVGIPIVGVISNSYSIRPSDRPTPIHSRSLVVANERTNQGTNEGTKERREQTVKTAQESPDFVTKAASSMQRITAYTVARIGLTGPWSVMSHPALMGVLSHAIEDDHEYERVVLVFSFPNSTYELRPTVPFWVAPSLVPSFVPPWAVPSGSIERRSERVSSVPLFSFE
ncbi:hypothetical protein TCAL_08429 [Tigriopus californicus]|uniref:Neurotransmitter-gated ion-channel ligand-binding domain-containing protein n=1 Tax=Tigriopus californicus TaxID=6832 RepID=A0A553N985_TIGCA|nr:glycine receptor subunit alpha-4-like [Tigriopus californicus]TRY62011.1 hypothetical protein TCAL_08429 [Tigriopus californicus]